ncbi:MAG: sulfotransferase family 2 domain-containing protein [Pseudomonadota bacterium]|nr:sulfotransferase family 2 domain-containing protein [Pseudomonadota bacterium]
MISHRHRTIFVHIPKCGGQSVEQAFLDDLGLSWGQRAPLMLGRNPSKGVGPPRLAHLSARDYTRHHYVTDQMWADYFTFTVVRDPVARAVSMFNHLRPVDSLPEFLHDWLPEQFTRAPDDRNAKFHFVRPQVDFLAGDDGTLLPDRVFHLETLGRDWPEVQSAAKLKAPLPHRNRSDDGATPRDLEDRDLDQIAMLYAKDFTALGYALEAPSPKPSLFRNLGTKA